MAEDLAIDGETINQFIETLSAIYKQQHNEKGEIEDIDILLVELTEEIKSFNIEKGLVDHIAFIIFQSIFDKNVSGQQITRNTPILKNLYKRFCIMNEEIQNLLNF